MSNMVNAKININIWVVSVLKNVSSILRNSHKLSQALSHNLTYTPTIVCHKNVSHAQIRGNEYMP